MPNLTLRLPDDLHHLAKVGAATRGQSLHAYILAALRAHVLHQARRSEGASVRVELERRPLADEPE